MTLLDSCNVETVSSYFKSSVQTEFYDAVLNHGFYFLEIITRTDIRLSAVVTMVCSHVNLN